MATHRVANLYKPTSFVNATHHQKKFICNGCGSANAKFDFVPDSIYGLKIKSVCDIHDWMYSEGRTLEDKEEADRVFLNNLLRLIEVQRGWLSRPLKVLRRRRALKYYEAVTAYGGPAFWTGKS